MPRDMEKRRVYMRTYIAEWRKRNPKRWKQPRPPEVHRAGEAVRRAVRSGRLIRPDVCSKCGEAGPIEAAHADYSAPLDVVWLCRPCHRLWDYHEPKVCKP